MNKKQYMIAVDTSLGFDADKMAMFLRLLNNNGLIDGWWHYIHGGFFIVNTHLTVNEIYNLLIKHIPQRKHLIMEVNPKNQQGWLTKDAWNWFSTLT